MRVKREVHPLSGYLIEGAGRGPPLPTPPHTIFFCSSSSSPLSASTLNRKLPEYRSLSIIVANSNNFQTHPVCNLLSANEINPSENIFNKNVMQNGISKIVKSWRFLLKSGRLQPHYIDSGGYNIRRYTPIQPGTEELLLSSRKVHPPVVKFDGKQDSLIGLKAFSGEG